MEIQDVPEDQYFAAINGAVIKNLQELDLALDNFDDETFAHHVNDQKHDIAAWVRGSVKDEELAGALENIKDKKSIQIAILRRIIA